MNDATIIELFGAGGLALWEPLSYPRYFFNTLFYTMWDLSINYWSALLPAKTAPPPWVHRQLLHPHILWCVTTKIQGLQGQVASPFLSTRVNGHRDLMAVSCAWREAALCSNHKWGLANPCLRDAHAHTTEISLSRFTWEPVCPYDLYSPQGLWGSPIHYTDSRWRLYTMHEYQLHLDQAPQETRFRLTWLETPSFKTAKADLHLSILWSTRIMNLHGSCSSGGPTLGYKLARQMPSQLYFLYHPVKLISCYNSCRKDKTTWSQNKSCW